MDSLREYLLQIVEKSSGFYERLGNDYIIPQTSCKKEINEKRLARWQQIVAGGDENLFIKRFLWEEHDMLDVRNIIDSAKWKYKDRLPDWVHLLAESLAVSKQQSGISYRFLDEEEKIPFEECFIPFIITAVQMLKNSAGKKYEVVSPAAHRMLERILLKKLSSIGAFTFQFEFEVFKKYNELFRNSTHEQNTSSFYTAFINSVLENELSTILYNYPVLAKLLATTAHNWAQSILELIQRYVQDQELLANYFNSGKEMGEIVEVSSHLSDAHHHGRTVMIVTCTSGIKFVYKPRDVGIEENFYNLLEWINLHQTTNELHLHCLKVLNRNEYGWVEYVEQIPCISKAEVIRYYKRSGMLLCLLSVLSGTDFHYENVIAHGEYPIPVDMEMLFNPFLVEGFELKAQDYTTSVLRTGILPSLEGVQDMSALSGGANLKTPFKVPIWEHINTDQMKYALEIQDVKPGKNRIYLNEQQVSPLNYRDEIMIGYKLMYGFLSSYRNGLLEIQGPIEKFKNVTGRFVIRPTMQYSFYLKHTLYPHLLKDGIDRSIELDQLTKELIQFEHQPKLWLLLKAEQLSLEELDIPYFSFNITDRYLAASNSSVRIENLFKTTPYEFVRTTLRNLTPAILHKQLAIIESVFLINSPINQSFKQSNYNTSKKELHAKAVSIADYILEKYSPTASISKMSGFNLYVGSLGVAYFYAATAKVTNIKKYKEQALKEVENFCKEFQGKAAETFAEQYGIGGTTGLGSLVYSLVRISHFLNESEILAEAKRIADMITPERIEKDHVLDVMSGSAGALIALVTVYETTRHDEVLNRAVVCGKHLLSHLTLTDTGHRAWKNKLIDTAEGKLLSGISHGAAGIAYALARLYKVTKEEDFKMAAEEALNYESSIYCKEKCNWPDYRLAFMSGKSPNFMSTWCYGWPGIGLSRMGISSIWASETINRDVNIVLQNARQWRLGPLDHLCCGNFGILDVMLTAKMKFREQNWERYAMQLASLVLEREKIHGEFALTTNSSDNDLDYSLFRGLAGIGYELLRLANPDQLPSVLLLE
ncbi:type 2 lanthipeptide synthetase LanM family protein [Bacillus sp. Marseille-P3661]|uniref:type 2 lanthipeptide synthetase LanM family protein n=1 Tax=Bacillus sp. Marseille-P3661 TaxID=1936234 RepID=UPI000C844CC1|nr:type 2 lanthipeptide synthetase LanM family protein [Bacillus sp. Marseille-P3661]